jgi:hypothetical protein
MAWGNESSLRLSLQTTALHMTREQSKPPNKSTTSSRQEHQSTNNENQHHTHMTPPTTPDGFEEELAQQGHVRPAFYKFLRAFYQFQPEQPVSETTVTLPLNEGDIILVHSIHTNGWADGTLLSSGARGWLPTNYCEGYEPDSMRNLLASLERFWDLLRSRVELTDDIFRNQEFMRGIIAGVRYLLVREPYSQ